MLLRRDAEAGETLEQRIDVVRGSGRAELGDPPREVRRALVDEPVPQRPRHARRPRCRPRPSRGARVALLLVLLEGDDGAGPLVDLVVTLIVGEALEELQPVPLHAHLNGVAGHQQEVDEHALVDEVGERRLSDGVLRGEGFER